MGLYNNETLGTLQKLETDNSRLLRSPVVADNIISEEFTVGLQYAPDSLVTFVQQEL